MNLQNVDLKLLIYLDALLDERSVTKAAAKVCISQSAMSNALNKIRTLLDDPVLIRTSQGMLPTQRALVLHNPLKIALSQLGETLAIIETFNPETTNRTFSISLTDYASSVLLPSLIPAIKAEAPECNLRILDGNIALEQLEQGQVDLAINAFTSLPDTFYEKKLWQESYNVIARRDHPSIKGDLDLPTYLTAEHIMLSKSGVGPGTVDVALAEKKLARRVSVQTKHFHLTPRLVENSNLLATVPTKLAIDFQKHYAIQLFPPPFELPPFQYSLVWSSIAHHDPAIHWLRNKIMEAAERI